jgi:hypothetical protein
VTDPAAVKRSPEHWFVFVTALAAPLGLVLLALVLRPDPRGFGTHEQLGFQPCLPIRLWNLPCPGCGVTTAVTLALHGHPLRSLATQPFGLVTIALVLAFAVFAVRTHRRGEDLFQALERLPWMRLGVPVAVLLVVGWIWKTLLVRGVVVL